MKSFEKIVIANWKMSLSLDQSFKVAYDIGELVEKKKINKNIEVVVCPSFLALRDVSEALEGSRVALGAQDAFYGQSGAYTGEISPQNLKEAGCQYVILGHSERRAMGETDEDINKKVKAVMDQKMTPIICVGELLGQRQDNKTKNIISKQVKRALEGVSSKQLIIIAYEPVWAISTSGSGKTIEPDQAIEEIKFIQEIVPKSLDTMIIYGGSVNEKNIHNFIGNEFVDGALVGSASLKAKTFVQLIKNI